MNKTSTDIKPPEITYDSIIAMEKALRLACQGSKIAEFYELETRIASFEANKECFSARVVANSPILLESTEATTIPIHQTEATTIPIHQTIKRLGEESKDIARRIKNFSALKENWDSYGAKRIEVSTISRAIEFYVAIILFYPKPPTPFVVPACNGDIQFTWKGRSVKLKHSIPSNQNHAYKFLITNRSSGETKRVSGLIDSKEKMIQLVLNWIKDTYEQQPAEDNSRRGYLLYHKERLTRRIGDILDRNRRMSQATQRDRDDLYHFRAVLREVNGMLRLI